MDIMVHLIMKLTHATHMNLPTTLMDELMKTYKKWCHFVLETYRSRFEELFVVMDHISLESYLDKQHQHLNIKLNKAKFTN